MHFTLHCFSPTVLNKMHVASNAELIKFRIKYDALSAAFYNIYLSSSICTKHVAAKHLSKCVLNTLSS